MGHSQGCSGGCVPAFALDGGCFTSKVTAEALLGLFLSLFWVVGFRVTFKAFQVICLTSCDRTEYHKALSCILDRIYGKLQQIIMSTSDNLTQK